MKSPSKKTKLVDMRSRVKIPSDLHIKEEATNKATNSGSVSVSQSKPWFRSSKELAMYVLFCICVVTAVPSDIHKTSSKDHPTSIGYICHENESVSNNLGEIKPYSDALAMKSKKLHQLSDLDVKPEPSSTTMPVILKQNSSIDVQLNFGRPKTTKTDQKHTTNEILESIECGNFKLAEKIINQYGDTEVIPEIVHKLYTKSDTNFDKILTFARTLSSWNIKYKILVALDDELQTLEHQQPEKQLQLLEAFEYDLIAISDENVPDNLMQSAFNASYDLIIKIESSTTKYLIKGLLTGDIETDPEYILFMKTLYELRPKVANKVVKRVINGTYGVSHARKLLNYILGNLNTSLAIEATSKLFWNIEKDGRPDLTNEIVMKLASNLAKLHSNVDFPQSGSIGRKTFEKAVAELPACARNLVFAPTVCLWNKARESYLEVADSKYNYDGERRNIFTRVGGSPNLSAARWEVVHFKGNILFKSDLYPSEFLYVAQFYYSRDPQMHYVFNWIPGNNTDYQSAFEIELQNDHCYLKSVYFGEYLVAPTIGYQEDSQFSQVFTRKAVAKNKEADSAWQIREC